MSRRLLVGILLVAVTVALLMVASMGEPPDIQNDEVDDPCVVSLRDQIADADQRGDRGKAAELRKQWERQCPGYTPPP